MEKFCQKKSVRSCEQFACAVALLHAIFSVNYMKPKDLKPPTTWEERYVTIQDRVWYVPEHYQRYDQYTFPGWRHGDLFGNDHPVVIEYCSGNGTWIAHRAAEHAKLNWLAVEKRFDRVRKIWSKIKNQALGNLVALCGEAETATRHYFPAGSVDAIYINFPDPWPKKRHAKHRLIKSSFLDEMERILKSGGTVCIVTDDPDYSELVIEEFARHPSFSSSYPAPYYITDLPDYGASYFEELWREKGRVIRYHLFQRLVSAFR